MNFNSLNQTLIFEFPEIEPSIQKLRDDWDDEEPGQYIVYEDIFGRFIKRLLLEPISAKRDALLSRCFSFIDRLLLTGGEVENLGFVAMLENQPEWWYARAKVFLLDKTINVLNQWDRNWIKWQNTTIDDYSDLAEMIDVLNNTSLFFLNFFKLLVTLPTETFISVAICFEVNHLSEFSLKKLNTSC